MGPRFGGKPADLPAEDLLKAGSPKQEKEELETIEYPAEEINPDEIPF